MQDQPLNDKQRNAILKGAKMSLLENKQHVEQKAPTLEDKLEYLDYLIERMENVVSSYEEFVNENHHVSKKSSDVSITIGSKRFAGKMSIQK